MIRLDEDVGPLSSFTVATTAGISATIAAAASHGFDTAKNRAECIVIPKVLACLQYHITAGQTSVEVVNILL